METVGDKYMAVSGLPEPCDAHAKNIANLALDMMQLLQNIRTADLSGMVSFLNSSKVAQNSTKKI